MLKIRSKDNRGLSLVELMIALAVLAMLMTAVIMMMSNNSIMYRKTKADISVQTTAQETFNAIQDVVMQANEITIEGASSFDNAMSNTNVKTFKRDDGSFAGATDPVYPTKMTVKYSVKGKTNKIENYSCEATYYFVRYKTKLDGKDTEDSNRCNIYVLKKYSAGSGRSNSWKDGVPTKNATTDNLADFSDYLLTSSLSDVFFKINADSQSIAMDFDFNDRHMEYHTNGTVVIRNSYVMYDKGGSSSALPGSGD